jgi:hypothetical protein
MTYICHQKCKMKTVHAVVIELTTFVSYVFNRSVCAIKEQVQ